MTWPDDLVERARRAPDLDLGVVDGSTPVVSFGDPVEAPVATLGINPSSSEFLGSSGALFGGPERRLATLASLGVERYDELTPDHAAAIVDDCASYFDRRPYRWFDPLNDVIHEALGVSYVERSACHLDLVQWATKPLWGELPADIQDELLRQDLGFLRRQLGQSHYRVVVVNGRSAMSWVERSGLVRWQPVCTLDGPPTAQVCVGQARDVRFVGWSCNLQSQHGAPRHAPRLAELLAEHVRTPRPTARPATGHRRAAATPTRTTGGPASSRPAPGDVDGGPVPKGLHFTHKSELVSYLTVWLERSTHDTIGDVGAYGGSAWMTVDSEVGPIGINRDTTHAAVEALVTSARTPRSYDWLVVENQKGRINRVLFSEERTPGWYAYLREPLDRETRLGVAPEPHPAVGPADEAAPDSPPPRDRRDAPAAAANTSPVLHPATPRHRPDHEHDGGGRAAIVQFPHPGGEHVPPTNHMPWNVGPHARKFLASPGAFVDSDGTTRTGELVFWGEWEGPSHVVRRWLRRPDLPTVLHEPYWTIPDIDGSRQNTDPWVFGDTFLYSNCKQLTPTCSPSALQRLPRGSMILFGSGRGGEFVIDTVFVVGEIVGTYRPLDNPHDLGVDDAFDTCTLQSLGTYEPEKVAATFTLYRGATVDKPVDGMFSFVPCLLRDDDEPRFPRPAVRLPGIVNPLSKQSPAGAKDLWPRHDVDAAWHEVVHQVRSAGLDLGVHLDTPPKGA